MTLSEKTWKNYIAKLRKVNDKAAELMEKYLSAHDVSTREGRKAMLDYAYSIATRYGEGTAELACQMYDMMADASGAPLSPAEPAQTATYGEVARAVQGEMLRTDNNEQIAAAIGRLVKLAGADTTLNNALRDGAEFAWIPSGDTCPYCLMLASRGWQRASRNAIKNGHAEHIHANCDCSYQIRFNPDTKVSGYDPDKLREQYEAGGSTQSERINALRRQLYSENSAKINAQKREAYRRRKESENV
jgi:hypothetical protein